MDNRHDLWAVANLLIGRYGSEAKQRAASNAANAERTGDATARVIWADVGSLLAGDRREAAEFR